MIWPRCSTHASCNEARATASVCRSAAAACADPAGARQCPQPLAAGPGLFRRVRGAAVALPLGIAMGAYKGIEAFFEPFVSFCRYLPASAFIPLLILWAGIGEAQKILVIFIGSVFQITLMVAVTVGSARRDLVEAA